MFCPRPRSAGSIGVPKSLNFLQRGRFLGGVDPAFYGAQGVPVTDTKATCWLPTESEAIDLRLAVCARGRSGVFMFPSWVKPSR